MDKTDNSENRERLKRAVLASHTAAKEVTKDAAHLSRQAALLKAKAVEMRLEAQETRAQSRPDHSSLPSAVLFTIPEAAAYLHVAERTLRHVLSDPERHARLVERTRKVGIYYKFLPLVPLDLMKDLVSHFAQNKIPQRKNLEGG